MSTRDPQDELAAAIQVALDHVSDTGTVRPALYQALERVFRACPAVYWKLKGTLLIAGPWERSSSGSPGAFERRSATSSFQAVGSVWTTSPDTAADDSRRCSGAILGQVVYGETIEALRDRIDEDLVQRGYLLVDPVDGL